KGGHSSGKGGIVPGGRIHVSTWRYSWLMPPGTNPIRSASCQVAQSGHSRLPRRISLCSRRGRHYGFSRYEVFAAGPAGELCRLASEGIPLPCVGLDLDDPVGKGEATCPT